MNFKKVLALFISLIFVAMTFVTAASAVEYRVGGTKGDTAISDSYSASVYHEYLKKIQLTGDGRIDAVAIALSQIGYQEGNDNTQFAGTYPGSSNYTEFNVNMGDFGSGYGGSAYPWCASFVSFSLYQARTHDLSKYSDICRNHTNDSDYIWKEIGCQKWREQLDACGYLKDGKAHGGTYTPRTGDLIFFGNDYSHSSHIGLVVYCDGSKVYTVEGNTSQAAGLESNGGGVYFKSYALTNSRILGYGVLPYKTNADALVPDYTGKKFTTGVYVNTNFENSGADIQTYSDTACTKKAFLIKTNNLFEITEFVSEDIAKVTFYTVSNTTYAQRTGYMRVDNVTSRVVQAVNNGETYSSSTVDPPTPPTPPDPTTNTLVSIEKGNGYVAHSVADYTVDGESKGTEGKRFTLTSTGKLGIAGYAGFSQSIINSGYYLDDDTDGIYWNSNFLSAGDAAATAAGGAKAKNYNIVLDVANITAGEHTVSFVLKLSDGTFVIIDTLSFIREENKTNDGQDEVQPGNDSNTSGENTTTAPVSDNASRCGSTIGGISGIIIAMAATLAALISKKRK